MRRVRPLGRRSAAAERSRSSTCPRTLGFSLRRQLAQQTPRQPNRIGASKLRCPFAVRSSYFYHSVLNRIRSADRTALKLSRKFLPDNRSLQRRVSRLAASLFEAAPGVYRQALADCDHYRASRATAISEPTMEASEWAQPRVCPSFLPYGLGAGLAPASGCPPEPLRSNSPGIIKRRCWLARIVLISPAGLWAVRYAGVAKPLYGSPQ
jgi:hypothetical protein